MKRKLGWVWLSGLIVIPLVAMGAFALKHVMTQGSLAGVPAPTPTPDSLTWSEIKPVENRNPPARRTVISPMGSLPSAGSTSDAFAFYLAAKDLSKLDLTDKGQVLSDWATFDSRTIWPEKMPADFSPQQILELGKNPGLGLQQLHQQGITGKGVQVAIIDQTLLRNHREYDGRIVKYTELGTVAPEPEMHGAAVASILAGKNVGVAPGAEVTYYAAQFMKDGNWRGNERTFLYMAAAINKILDDNQKLPPEKRIRVISASIGAGPNEHGASVVYDAYRRAVKEGVLVVTTDMQTRYAYQVHGLGRQPMKDPNLPASYEPGKFWASFYFSNGGKLNTQGTKLIFAPMDTRTTAAESGTGDYRFYRDGGLSWSVPWMAGVYALVCQVNPQVTPEQFLQVAYDTGDYITVANGSKEYKLGPIMNPTKIVDHFKK